MLISLSLFLAGLAITFLGIPVLVVLHFLMPKEVLARYWREPYFTPFELGLFSVPIFGLLRTASLMRGIAYPRLGQRRGITEANLLVPRWYVIASKAFTLIALSSLPLVVLGIVGVTVDGWLSDGPTPWEETIALLVALGCFGGVGMYQRNMRRHRDKGRMTQVQRR